MTDGGRGAETPNIAALPAIARLGACESARGPDADRRVKLLSQFAVEGHTRVWQSLSLVQLPLRGCPGLARTRPVGRVSRCPLLSRLEVTGSTQLGRGPSGSLRPPKFRLLCWWDFRIPGAYAGKL